jgi:hypothetical protein
MSDAVRLRQTAAGVGAIAVNWRYGLDVAVYECRSVDSGNHRLWLQGFCSVLARFQI